MKLNGQVAIVTGGGTGVGKATSLKLAAEGCTVIVNYSRSQKEAAEIVNTIEEVGGRALSHQADVGDDQQVKEMVEEATSQFGRLDILVNNAGTTEFISFKDLESANIQAWERIFRVNVIGAFQMARACARAMQLTSGKGHIVNVSSIAGLNATGSSIPYAAS
ncbi:MAG: 3-ketoacyl-ACP reductase, partial [Verrucomicrobia bacterium]|nr:3-ketoacyl-ACP reductase [Verrucomicrobiota bacterium]